MKCGGWQYEDYLGFCFSSLFDIFISHPVGLQKSTLPRTERGFPAASHTVFNQWNALISIVRADSRSRNIWWLPLNKHEKTPIVGSSFFFWNNNLIITDLEAIKVIMVKHFDHFVNHSNSKKVQNEPHFERAIFNRENEEWKNLQIAKMAINFTFTYSKIKPMYSIFNASSKALV